MTWFDLFHHILLGCGVLFIIALIMVFCQWVRDTIIKVHAANRSTNEQTTQTIHTHHSEEHRIHHVNHHQYEDEPVSRSRTVKTVKTPPVEYQRVSQSIEQPRAITRVKR